MNNARAFTLLELLVVVAIIGILTMVAYPAYTAHILKTHRSQAKMDLLNLASCLETYNALHNSYKNATLAACNFKTNNHDNYRYEIAAEEETFEISAIPERSQIHDICGILSLDQAGHRRSAAHPEVNNNCW